MRTKGELYDFMRAGRKKIFIHQENEWLQGIAHGLDKIAYGREMHDDTFVAGRVIVSHPFLSFQWIVWTACLKVLELWCRLY